MDNGKTLDMKSENDVEFHHGYHRLGSSHDMLYPYDMKSPADIRASNVVSVEPQREIRQTNPASDDMDQMYVHETTDDNSMQSEISEEVVLQNDLEFQDYNMLQPEDEAQDTNVLLRLDSLLREKVDLQVDEFRASLHEILDNQINLVQNLVQLSVGQSQESRSSSGIENDLSRMCSASVCNQQTQSDEERNVIMVQLFTSAAIVSNTLRRTEFHT